MLAYLEPWTQRPSWRAAMWTSAVDNAVMVRGMANKLMRMVPDLCTEEELGPCVERARAADASFSKAIDRAMKSAATAGVGSEISGWSGRAGGRTSYAPSVQSDASASTGKREQRQRSHVKTSAQMCV